eukprot:TRINITY_DN2890_c0_g1_i1.p1 TRINITY_DN2890_c0_g1~~TRINITY_DN2890_c0_g1_i1.p1  ORF type:complete len:507 (+),score=157.12 TRINITY_DN2890_c0_g1_i1:64-1584(+)
MGKKQIASAHAERVFEVEQLVDRREKNGLIKYKVRWRNFKPQDDTWEKREDLWKSARELVVQFEAAAKDATSKSASAVPAGRKRPRAAQDAASTGDDVSQPAKRKAAAVASAPSPSRRSTRSTPSKPIEIDQDVPLATVASPALSGAKKRAAQVDDIPPSASTSNASSNAVASPGRTRSARQREQAPAADSAKPPADAAKPPARPTAAARRKQQPQQKKQRRDESETRPPTMLHVIDSNDSEADDAEPSPIDNVDDKDFSPPADDTDADDDDDADGDADEEFEVEAILAGPDRSGRYTVKWLGYDETTSQAASTLQHLDVFKTYLAKMKADAAAARKRPTRPTTADAASVPTAKSGAEPSSPASKGRQGRAVSDSLQRDRDKKRVEEMAARELLKEKAASTVVNGIPRATDTASAGDGVAGEAVASSSSSTQLLSAEAAAELLATHEIERVSGAKPGPDEELLFLVVLKNDVPARRFVPASVLRNDPAASQKLIDFLLSRIKFPKE